MLCDSVTAAACVVVSVAVMLDRFSLWVWYGLMYRSMMFWVDVVGVDWYWCLKMLLFFAFCVDCEDWFCVCGIW